MIPGIITPSRLLIQEMALWIITGICYRGVQISN